jgi:hypothetical protein
MGTICLLLSPFLIGIFIWISYKRRQEHEASLTWWHCESCGYRLATTPATKPFPLVVRLIALAVLVGILIWAAFLVIGYQQATVKYEPNDPPSFHNAADTGKEKGNRQKRESRSHQVDPRRTRHTERSQDETDQSSNQKD